MPARSAEKVCWHRCPIAQKRSTTRRTRTWHRVCALRPLPRDKPVVWWRHRAPPQNAKITYWRRSGRIRQPRGRARGGSGSQEGVLEDRCLNLLVGKLPHRGPHGHLLVILLCFAVHRRRVRCGEIQRAKTRRQCLPRSIRSVQLSRHDPLPQSLLGHPGALGNHAHGLSLEG